MTNHPSGRKHEAHRARARFVSGFWDGVGSISAIWQAQGGFPRQFSALRAGSDWSVVGDDLAGAFAKMQD
jgi:hypothetical protein